MPGPGHYNPAINTVGHEPQGALTTKFQGRAKNVQGKFSVLFKILIYNLLRILTENYRASCYNAEAECTGPWTLRKSDVDGVAWQLRTLDDP